MLEKQDISIIKILCNMKNKILFGCVSILFVAATAFNIGLLQTKDAGDVSLDAITIMAQAHDGESGNGDGSSLCSKIKRTCNCYDNNGLFMSISILECEEYIAYPPQECKRCQTTPCVPGSRC